MFGLEQSHSGHFDAVVISHRSLVVPAILLHDLRALCFRVTYIIHSNDPFPHFRDKITARCSARRADFLPRSVCPARNETTDLHAHLLPNK